MLTISEIVLISVCMVIAVGAMGWLGMVDREEVEYG